MKKFFMEHKLLTFFLLLILIGVVSGIFGDSRDRTQKRSATDISKFEYSIEGNNYFTQFELEAMSKINLFNRKVVEICKNIYAKEILGGVR